MAEAGPGRRASRWSSSTPFNVKIREGQVANRPIYLALGVTVDGERDVLGLWAGKHGDGERPYWMRVCSEIKNRGTWTQCHVDEPVHGLAGARRLATVRDRV